MLRFRELAVAVALVGLANLAWAHCGTCDKGSKAAGEKQCTTSCEGACPITAAMKSLPKMTYKVGTEATCCSQSAAKLAEKAGQPIHFVVASKTYDSREEATVALAKATEKLVDDFAKPSTCKVSGVTTVAGQNLHCAETAAKLASLVQDAISGVSMTYKVGDEQCACPNRAKVLASKSGKKTEFVIGSETTCCPVDARVKLAQAKYRAAVATLVKAQAKEKTKVAATSET